MIKPNQIMIKSSVRDKKSDKLMIRSNTTLDLFFPTRNHDRGVVW